MFLVGFLTSQPPGVESKTDQKKVSIIVSFPLNKFIYLCFMNGAAFSVNLHISWP